MLFCTIKFYFWTYNSYKVKFVCIIYIAEFNLKFYELLHLLYLYIRVNWQMFLPLRCNSQSIALVHVIFVFIKLFVRLCNCQVSRYGFFFIVNVMSNVSDTRRWRVAAVFVLSYYRCNTVCYMLIEVFMLVRL